jgi:hypothetical protein
MLHILGGIIKPEVNVCLQAAPCFFSRRSRNARSDQKLGRRGVGLVIPMPVNKVSERRSGLRPSENELPNFRSGSFRHKNTHVCKKFKDSFQ